MYPKDIKIRANDISAAAGEILSVLEGTDKANVIYFDGWDHCGASAALKVVAQRLKSSKVKFDKVIHVDCSEWKSKRALQRLVAEELELPVSVMAIFDWHDEDDDFNGVEERSRGVISDVTGEIFRKLANSRFVVIFHNGSGDYIDLYECGVPITSFLSNKVLWTWRGRFRLLLKLEDGEKEKMSELTDAIIRTSDEGINDEAFWDLLCGEVREVVNYIGIPRSKMSHMMVEECFLYAVALGCAGNINWGTHASNYWVCDGIIQGQGNTSAWEIGDALHRNMHSQWLLQETPIQGVANDAIRHCLQRRPRDRWVSATHRDILQDASITVLPVEATSLFLLANKPYSMMILPASMFQHSDSSRLRVLHLSWCTFHFASPPFLYCSQLRFLLLDHCTNIADKEYQSHNQNISCFQKLWVLDLRNTDWSWLLSEKMMSLMVDLRELNLEGVKHWSITDLCGSGTSLVKLRLIVDPIPTEDDTNIEATIPDLSSANNLKTIILDGCVGLEHVVHDFLPPWIESFSFINKAAAAAKISSISLQGCTKLKDVLLRGLLGSLQELDLSGTAVKTLDLREVEAPNLKCLTMLGCRKLRAILWPPETEKTHVLEVLHVSTTQSAELGTSQFASFDFAWHIFVRDARLLRSILPTEEPSYAHVEIDSSPTSSAAVGGSTIAQGARNLWQRDHYLYARDVAFQGHVQAIAPNEGVIIWMLDCPAIPDPEDEDLYVHIQDEEDMKSGLLQLQGNTEGTGTSAALSPDLICGIAQMLHVHDRLSITSIPFQRDSDWSILRWCRVERCPELRSVFAIPQEIDGGYVFRLLATFWASQLPMACYIWNWSAVAQPGEHSFEDLVFLHLDYCPRLIHVLPLSAYMTTLHSLETLEIVCCGDLREVFPLDLERQEQQEIIKFPELRCIHLYELPMLQRICGCRMSAPNLETVKIRGCWSLGRLPAVSGSTTKRPKVDCEKDWFDNLEWDGLEANHDPSLYEPSHSRYYKKAHLPRGTVLR